MCQTIKQHLSNSSKQPQAITQSATTHTLYEWLFQLVLQLQAQKFRLSSRAELRRLDDRQLADIGVTRQQADAEINKPFWKA